MSRALKATTGLTGLAVAHNPHRTLSALYNKILRALEKMPTSAVYRQHTESIVKERLKFVETVKEVRGLEKEIKCGQIEELIVQAENELILARKMIAWKPWEKLTQEAPPQQWDWPPTKIMEPTV